MLLTNILYQLSLVKTSAANKNYLTNLSFKVKIFFILNINKPYNIIFQLGSWIIHDHFVRENIFKHMEEYINKI